MAPGMARTQTLPPPKGVCFAFWRSGSCDRGKACDFPHIQPAPDGVSAPWGVCFDFWNRGACAKELHGVCPFPHVQNPLGDWVGAAEEETEEQYPIRPGEANCDYYMRTGACSFGSSCKFNHPPLDQPVGRPHQLVLRTSARAQPDEGVKELVSKKRASEGGFDLRNSISGDGSGGVAAAAAKPLDLRSSLSSRLENGAGEGGSSRGEKGKVEASPAALLSKRRKGDHDAPVQDSVSVVSAQVVEATQATVNTVPIKTRAVESEKRQVNTKEEAWALIGELRERLFQSKALATEVEQKAREMTAKRGTALETQQAISQLRKQLSSMKKTLSADVAEKGRLQRRKNELEFERDEATKLCMQIDDDVEHAEEERKWLLQRYHRITNDYPRGVGGAAHPDGWGGGRGGGGGMVDWRGRGREGRRDDRIRPRSRSRSQSAEM